MGSGCGQRSEVQKQKKQGNFGENKVSKTQLKKIFLEKPSKVYWITIRGKQGRGTEKRKRKNGKKNKKINV